MATNKHEGWYYDGLTDEEWEALLEAGPVVYDEETDEEEDS